MRNRLSLVTLFAVLVGCQGPIMTGGFNQSPYRSYGVDGPGPGVIAENYQPMSHNAPMGPPPAVAMAAPGPVVVPGEMCPPMMPMMRPQVPTSQVSFVGLEGLTINWDVRIPRSFDSQPCICPATHNFMQGAIYRLKLTSIPGHQGKELYPTLEIAPTMARTQAFLAHNSIPVEFTDNDFDQVLSGNFITKVVYLPNPEFQGLAMAGVGTLVNTQLEPGVDPIVEASNRGAILAVIRMGNKDLGQAGAGPQPGMMIPPGMMVAPPQGGPGMGAYPVNGSSIPQNAISGVNIPPYGTPMTKTTSGIPGPPQLPQGMHTPNRYPVVRTEPVPAPPVGYDVPSIIYHPQYMTQQQPVFAVQPVAQQPPAAQQPTIAPAIQQPPSVQQPLAAQQPTIAPSNQQPQAEKPVATPLAVPDQPAVAP